MNNHPGSTQVSYDTEEENFSFRKLLTDWWRSILFALRFWRIIAIVVIMGGLLGLGYAYLKKTTYTARLTFVVEEGKSGSSGSLASLAGQVGLDIGGIMGGGSGMLAGDNVLELVKSHRFVKKALLSPYNDTGSAYSLADRYAEVYGWKEDWLKSSKVGRQIDFPVNKQSFSRTEDSLIQLIIRRLVEKGGIAIGKPDKKLGLFELSITTLDEKFSQLFCERLLTITADFYIDTKTSRLSTNVARLQRRADSLGILLDRKTYSSADAERMLLDANPAYTSAGATSEINTRNKFIQSTVYAEVIKNLEISKTALSQETPAVQVVDRPEMPLKKNRTSYLFSIVLGMMVAGAITVVLLASRYKG